MLKGDSVEGIKLNSEEGEKLSKCVENMKGRFHKQKVCKYCREPIMFKEDDKGRYIPFDLDETPHWKTCPYEKLTQKRASFAILKKAAVYFSLKMPDVDLVEELGLTEKEGKILHAVLERVLREMTTSEEEVVEQKVEGDLTFKPEPNDPIGDPDEDIAPDEELVKNTDPSNLVQN